jgi:hypothetical protein
MSAIMLSTRIMKEICDSLGLKHVTRLVLTFDLESIVTADATFFPQSDDLQKLPAITKRYHLIETKDKGTTKDDDPPVV